MPSALPEPPDLVIRLRQQLILAQVRIMELEDVRESLTPQVAGLEQLLRQAQILADAKTGEAAHLERVLADLQTQFTRLNEAHQQAAQDLAATRAALAETDAQLARQTEAAAALTATGNRLEAELRAIRSSRSWRWTAWLRGPAGK
jgi:chromosome segregation ATPase